MTTLADPPPAGQEAGASLRSRVRARLNPATPPTTPEARVALAREARATLGEVRTLAADALAPRGLRTRSRAYLRKSIFRRIRALEVQIEGLTPAVDPAAG